MVKPVNTSRSNPLNSPTSATKADSRLYLQDSELDQGHKLLRLASRQLKLRATHAAKTDLTSFEMDILIEVFETDNLDVSTLRESLDAPRQSLARHLNYLEEKQLVKRENCKKDGRRRILTLTESGRKLTQDAARGWRELLMEIYSEAGPEDVSAMRRILKLMVQKKTKTSIKNTSGTCEIK